MSREFHFTGEFRACMHVQKEKNIPSGQNTHHCLKQNAMHVDVFSRFVA